MCCIEELVPQQTQWREQGRAEPDAWLKAGAVGMLLPDVPHEYGGGGGTFAHQAVVIEELARAGVHFGSSVAKGARSWESLLWW